MLSDRLEELTDKAFRRPVRETDLATTPAHADKLPRAAFLIRREHHAKGGYHRIEAAILEREGLRVGLAEFDLQTFRGSSVPRAVKQRRHIVSGGHVAP